MIKKNKGITLVALVVTIIILLILAGITITELTGSGLLSKAKKAENESKYANAAEKVALAVNSSYDETGKLNDSELKENLNNIDGISPKIKEVKYNLEVIVDGYKFMISSSGKITGDKTQIATLPENSENTDAGTKVQLEDNWNTQSVSYIKTTDGTEVKTVETVATVYAVSDGKNNTIPVPNGFYYVGGNIDTGVVISDNENDEYTDKNVDKTAHSYATKLKGNQFVWIPCTAENYKKIKWGKENCTWDMETNSAEYNQIEKYGGFYVGRYEAGVSTLNEETGEFEDSVTFDNNASLFNAVTIQTGIINGWTLQNYNYTARQNGTIVGTGTNKSSGNIVEKANSIPYYHADYYTAIEMTRRMYKNDEERNKYVTSGLVTGTQWDMIIKYIQDEGTDVTSSNWGNFDNVSLGGETEDTKLRGYYTNASSNGATDGFKEVSTLSNGKTNSGTGSHVLLTTGSTEQVKKRNLYDIAGNLWEWTQEGGYADNLDYNLNEVFNTYTIRGGSLYHAYASYPACYRDHIFATATNTHYGFRTTLFIK